MQVKLIRYTQDALDLLLETKNTRMKGKPVEEMTDAEKQEHWLYMLDTIKSPFDFVDYIFDITEVSKNMTHQMVRTRTGAYQERTSRAQESSAFDAIIPMAFDASKGGKIELDHLWYDSVATIDALYQELRAAGAEIQDARSILPSNMQTHITAKFNLRTLSEMAKNRLCTRTQGEYQHVFRAMVAAVLEVHPWANPLLQPSCIGVGKCAFPRHGKAHCPWYRPWMDTTKEQEELRIQFWSANPITNNPVAKDGTSKG
ncbi:thymidylate synthase [Serratia phage vB_SmaM_Hera]|uniref:Thymidylate synthase n=2 Tax=Myosmarvirus MTx TaxID=2846180 RepID=A0A482MG31_9CAUD|nr:thymidylate synthase [Serratia phage MTx]QBQ72381.1 thymidylate synthase [Serratia phage MTx]QPX74691.1 thymidylate synthase [Serratia phage vB_SmaM_Hera]